MVLSLARNVGSSSAGQGILLCYENEGLISMFTKSTIGPNLYQERTIHSVTSHFLNLHFNIIFPSMIPFCLQFGHSHFEDYHSNESLLLYVTSSHLCCLFQESYRRLANYEVLLQTVWVLFARHSSSTNIKQCCRDFQQAIECAQSHF
jgi:hypothetical protein